MEKGIAVIRQHVEKIDGVSRTWIEWSIDTPPLVKTLVVEVNFDTDPNAPGFRQNVIDAIVDTAIGVQAEATMTISGLRIVPRGSR